MNFMGVILSLFVSILIAIPYDKLVTILLEQITNPIGVAIGIILSVLGFAGIVILIFKIFASSDSSS